MEITNAQHNTLLAELVQSLVPSPINPLKEFTIDMFLQAAGLPAREHQRVRRQLSIAVEDGQLAMRKTLYNHRLTNVYYKPDSPT